MVETTGKTSARAVTENTASTSMENSVEEKPRTSTDRLKRAQDLLTVYMIHLDETVKRDHTTKRMVFLTPLSAYSRNPQNLFLKGPSPTGKTYNVIHGLCCNRRI